MKCITTNEYTDPSQADYYSLSILFNQEIIVQYQIAQTARVQQTDGLEED